MGMEFRRYAFHVRNMIPGKRLPGPPKPKDEDSAEAGDEGKGLPPDGV